MNKHNLTKEDAKALLGLERDVDLARFFGCHKATVCCWKDRPIPRERYLELRVRRPDLFPDDSHREVR